MSEFGDASLTQHDYQVKAKIHERSLGRGSTKNLKRGPYPRVTCILCKKDISNTYLRIHAQLYHRDEFITGSDYFKFIERCEKTQYDP